MTTPTPKQEERKDMNMPTPEEVCEICGAPKGWVQGWKLERANESKRDAMLRLKSLLRGDGSGTPIMQAIWDARGDDEYPEVTATKLFDAGCTLERLASGIRRETRGECAKTARDTIMAYAGGYKHEPDFAAALNRLAGFTEEAIRALPGAERRIRGERRGACAENQPDKRSGKDRRQHG